ncbi:hypothetical protein VTN77DRAFT_1318 [Rasamsonia byssochlamydoides]|uniref:uncharacterized protein n=1 Tax=Rasamsonia byssochlamydoides TaxID=89139 RepID=UPI0037436BD0
MDSKFPHENESILKIKYILDPKLGGVRFPHLHEVYRDRVPDTITTHEAFSRCSHVKAIQSEDGGTFTWVRSDEEEYQMNEAPEPFKADNVSAVKIAFKSACSYLKDRFDIYGCLGKGTYGTVFAARSKKALLTDEFKHYALKVTEYDTLRKSEITGTRKEMGLWKDGATGEEHYLPEEAVIMLFLGKCDRFPKIDSVYTHGPYFTIVMSSALDGDDRMNADTPTEYKERYRAYNGHSMFYEKKTLLNEIQVCKVASQILEAMIYLRDMGIAHDDLSHYNYLISETLDVQVIDLGLVWIGLDDSEWNLRTWTMVPYQEYLLSPELAIELSKRYWWQPWRKGQQCRAHLPHDGRVEDAWKFACIVHELLHGYAPWEDPDWDESIGGIREWRRADPARASVAMDKVWYRRYRVINEEFPIDEGLSQDCVDVLRAMLQRDPAKRPDPRASLQDLSSFPWFQGQWVDRGPFERPKPREGHTW